MEKTYIVKKEHGADQIGSGMLAVLSTPTLLAFMEQLAQEEGQSHCQPGESTVGIEVQLNHLKATKIGQEVRIQAQLVEQNKRILTYDIQAWEGEEKIGQAQHKRAIINVESFLANL